MSAANFSTHPELRWRAQAEIDAILMGLRGRAAKDAAASLVENYRRIDEGACKRRAA